MLSYEPAKKQLMYFTTCYCRDVGKFIFGEYLVRGVDENLGSLQVKTRKGVVQKPGGTSNSLGAGETSWETKVCAIWQLEGSVLSKHAAHHLCLPTRFLEHARPHLVR